MELPGNRRWFGTALLAVFVGAGPALGVDFAREIRPILNQKCVACHGGVKQAGGVSFVYRDQVVGFEGESGNVVVKPGDLEGSELIYRITTGDEIDRMPPPEEHPEGLTEGEVALLSEWVREGAPWEEHWALVAPKRSEAPAVADEDWPRGPADRFVLAELEARGMQPNPPEEAARLLRRVSLDLTGLPPGPEEVEAFEVEWARGPDAALEAAVDDLLGRPAFGERWATMWLDLVRYADSEGLGQDGRRTIWKYRDWVIDAFNRDLPFDAFTVKQLAGDLLPEPAMEDLVATACQRNTQTNNEGGTDDEEFRMEAVLDRVNTTWQAWAGISFGCVQCHGHPYDAFRHEEYYQFVAFFNNSADSDLAKDEPLVRVPLRMEDEARARELDARILEIAESIWEEGEALKQAVGWEPLTGMTAVSSNGTGLVVEETAEGDEFRAVGTVRSRMGVTAEVALEAGKAVTALRLTVLPMDEAVAMRDSEWGFVLNDLTLNRVRESVGEGEGAKSVPVMLGRAVADVAYLPHDPFAAIGANGKGFAAFTRMHYPRELVLILKEPLEVREGDRLEVQLVCNSSALGAFPLVIKRGRFAVSRDPRWTEWMESERLREWNADRAAAEEARAAIASTTVPVLAERPERLRRPTHVFVRGNFLEKAEVVQAGTPASLPPLRAEGRADRLDLARWLVSGEHPLTGRVYVNRIWEQLFGTGLVATLEDFGSAGEPPSHPALLDDLAVRFQEDYAWSTKRLLRELVLSAPYRQSARCDVGQLEADPSNRWLGRGPRNRLSAEAIRDQALVIGGLLSERRGGAPVHPPIPDGVWKPFQGGDKWTTPGRGEEDRYRRSLYTYVKRSIPYPAAATFDAPSREFCNPRRLVSNTPLQALVTLNDAVFLECAQGLARRMKYDGDGSVEERLARGYRLATGSLPGEERLGELVGLFREIEATYAADPELARGLAGSADGAAYTVVAQVLLNLDEVLTK